MSAAYMSILLFYIIHMTVLAQISVGLSLIITFELMENSFSVSDLSLNE
jgi:hypothetical protein